MNQIIDISGRTEQVRNEILKQIGGGVKADEVTEEQLAGIRTLDLRNSGLHFLKKGDFEGLSGVLDFSIDGDQLHELPKGIFDDFGNIEDSRKLERMVREEMLGLESKCCEN